MAENETIARESSESELGSTLAQQSAMWETIGKISKAVPKVPVSWEDMQTLFLEHMAPAAPPGDAVPMSKFLSKVVSEPTFSEFGVSLDMNPNIQTIFDRVDDPNFPELADSGDEAEESREAASHPPDKSGLDETLRPPGLGVPVRVRGENIANT